MKDRKQKKSSERFIRIPFWVMNMPAWMELSFSSRALIQDLLMQYNGKNNGKLVLCEKALKPRGWTSTTTVTKCKKELIEHGFMVETRKGAKPNKASWYALTWLGLDIREGIDINPSKYRTLAQRQFEVRPSETAVERRMTVPFSDVRPPVATPETATIRQETVVSSMPFSGDYIEVAIPTAFEGECAHV
ncbi:hypothetical protein PQQ88_01165 [Paraburkholderia caledonica]|uniref:hypothetical protein n=1 Tax=Paraburkholderia caledonica TaxID=134536 RepID=UPI0038B8B625